MVKQLCVAYASWCPCPEWLEHGDFATDTNVYRCSAGGAQLKKAASEAAAWEIIKNHCVNSPFHKLNEEQWQYLVDGNLIKIKEESWQEPLPDDGEDGLIEAKEEPMSGEDRGRPSKRRRSEPEQGGGCPRGRRSQRATVASCCRSQPWRWHGEARRRRLGLGPTTSSCAGPSTACSLTP